MYHACQPFKCLCSYFVLTSVSEFNNNNHHNNLPFEFPKAMGGKLDTTAIATLWIHSLKDEVVKMEDLECRRHPTSRAFPNFFSPFLTGKRTVDCIKRKRG